MSTLRVWAHWTDSPPVSPHVALPNAPVPAPLQTYLAQGVQIPSDAGVPNYSIAVVPCLAWCELAKQDDIRNSKWFGQQGSPPPPFSQQSGPDYGDEGYGSSASGFRVTNVTVGTISIAGPKLNTEFLFHISAPSGGAAFSFVWDGSLSPVSPQFSQAVLNPFDGKGIWSITINRLAGSPTAAPRLGGGKTNLYANAAFEPYVEPNGLNEGYLYMTFEGDEIPSSSCPNVTVSASQPGECVNGRRSVTFHASINGVPANGAVLQWSFPNSVNPATTAFLVMNNGPLAPETVEYAADPLVSLKRTASLQVLWPANCPPAPGQPVSTSVTIDPCPSCCPSMTLDPPTVTGCAPGSAVATFSAALTWPWGCTPVTPSSTPSYRWTLDGPTGPNSKKYQLSTSTLSTDTSKLWKDPSGNLGPINLSAGHYAIEVRDASTDLDSSCDPTDPKSFFVPACCPKFTLNTLTATPASNNPCEMLFDVQVEDPAAVKSYDWTLNNTAIPALFGNKVPYNEYTFSPAAITTQTVKVTLTPNDKNCPPDTQSLTFSVNCPTTAPRVTGCTVTPGQSSGQVQVHFDSDVQPASATDPANFSLRINSGSPFNPSPGSLSYNSATRTTTISGLTLTNGDNVNVTVTGVRDASGTTLVDPNHNATSCTANCESGKHWDAGQGECVPDTPSTPNCGGWCIVAGIGIAILIGIQISTVAHCLLSGLPSVILSLVIGVAIVTFVDHCDICCLWGWLIVGAILGLAGTLVYWIWGGPPQCWLDGLNFLILYVSIAIGILIACNKARSSSL